MTQRRLKPLSERFWAKVQKSDGCWLWTGTIRGDGYGVIGEGRRGGRTIRAPRLSYELNVGPIGPGLFVCHSCDNPACVRPDHLFLGTNLDNISDAKAKSRLKPPPLHSGEGCHLSKLTRAQVLEIRTAAAAGGARKEIATRFGISKAGVGVIVRREVWKDVA